VDLLGERLGLLGVALLEADVRQKAECPGHPARVTDLGEGGDRSLDLLGGDVHVAGDERDPRHVLQTPGLTRAVADLDERVERLAHDAVGLVEAAAEQLDEPQLAQRVGPARRVPQLDERIGCGAQRLARLIGPTLALEDHAELHLDARPGVGVAEHVREGRAGLGIGAGTSAAGTPSGTTAEVTNPATTAPCENPPSTILVLGQFAAVAWTWAAASLIPSMTVPANSMPPPKSLLAG